MKEVLKTGRDLNDDDNNKLNKFDKKKLQLVLEDLFLMQ